MMSSVSPNWRRFCLILADKDLAGVLHDFISLGQTAAQAVPALSAAALQVSKCTSTAQPHLCCQEGTAPVLAGSWAKGGK